MKIISAPNKNWTMQVECRCGAVLEADRKDFRFVSDQRDGDVLICNCPICNADIWVDASLAPGKI